MTVNPLAGAGIKQRVARTRARQPLSTAYAWAAAILAGAIMPLAFQPLDWWPLIVPATLI